MGRLLMSKAKGACCPAPATGAQRLQHEWRPSCGNTAAATNVCGNAAALSLHQQGLPGGSGQWMPACQGNAMQEWAASSRQHGVMACLLTTGV